MTWHVLWHESVNQYESISLKFQVFCYSKRNKIIIYACGDESAYHYLFWRWISLPLSIMEMNNSTTIYFGDESSLLSSVSLSINLIVSWKCAVLFKSYTILSYWRILTKKADEKCLLKVCSFPTLFYHR